MKARFLARGWGRKGIADRSLGSGTMLYDGCETPVLSGRITVLVTALLGFTGALVTFTSGCSRAPSRIAAPDWDPDKSADRAIAEFDTDGDGLLTSAELAAAPGLKYCTTQLDADGDQKLSRDEIHARIKLYKDMRVGLVAFTCRVTLGGRPLRNATVRLVPEPFLGPIVEPAGGTSTADGQVQVVAAGADVPAARVGMYRVEITSPDLKIPAKYNTDTTLGVEISPVTDPYRRGGGPITFALTKG